MTRSSIQKSIVVLASRPILASIRDKLGKLYSNSYLIILFLGIITESFFDQKDFNSVEVLSSFYDSLKSILSVDLDETHILNYESVLTGIPVFPLIETFKTMVLKLLKAVLIGKKVI